jgi:hypothetical protein
MVEEFDEKLPMSTKESPYISLARIEERIKNLQHIVERDRLEMSRTSGELKEDLIKIVEDFKREMITRTDETKKDLISRADENKKEMITRAEFEPVKKIVYGIAGFLMLGIGGLIMSFVTKGLLLAPIVGGH